MELNQENILAELENCTTEEQIQDFYTKYLGKKWLIPTEFRTLWKLDPEARKTKWQAIKELQQNVEKSFFARQDMIKQEARNKKLQKELVDISLPGNKEKLGHLNLLNATRRTVEQIFQGMWFHIAYGHDMVNVYENFESVNIPATHPATEMHDTLYINSPSLEERSLAKVEERLLLRTHTSAHQIELIKKLWLPCKFVVPGKVYRNEKMDASHDCVFWQVEGVVIDKHISIAHFKAMMKQILQAILEQEVEMRLRPAYFPFVEPWFEIDARARSGESDKWLEILWAGMIHPHVLQEAWVDPDEYSGFAFGLWLSRLVAIRYGLNDIRLMTNGDLRFAQSF